MHQDNATFRSTLKQVSWVLGMHKKILLALNAKHNCYHSFTVSITTLIDFNGTLGLSNWPNCH